MAGIIEHDLIPTRDARFEIPQRRLHRLLREVLLQRHVEPHRLEFRRDRLCIGSGVLQLLHVLIAVVADHQREAARMRGCGQREREENQREELQTS